MALTMYHGHSYRPLYIVDITREGPKTPELETLSGATEKLEETLYSSPRFFRDPAQAHVLYLITNAFGDFASVVAYDTVSGTRHPHYHTRTGPGPASAQADPVGDGVCPPNATPTALFFRANVEAGKTCTPCLVPAPTHAGTGQVLEVGMREWEGSPVGCAANLRNGRPDEVVVHFNSFRVNGFLAFVDLSLAFEEGAEPERDEQGNPFISVVPRAYRQAAPGPPRFGVRPPRLFGFKSFSGPEVPCMYYHPDEGKTAVLVINIRGRPESQSTAETRMSVSRFLISLLS
jgi:hypothetical protein